EDDLQELRNDVRKVADKNNRLWVIRVYVSGFYFGMHFGMMVVLFVWVIWDSVIDDSKHHNLWESSVMAVYRAIGTHPCYGAGCTSLYMYKHVGVLVLLLWCWCVQVYVFTRFGIPFVAIFDWKPTKSVQFVSLVRHAVSVTIAYLVNLLVQELLSL
ncbi:hypothetical protein B5M09_010383, partial [Aphanomyces astaci]